ncbi:Acetylcholine receptor subunit alpha-type acr-16 [Folsomia candida]|uniref:Acetylcholine receptor subunit alpha-type acr-16 n=1 Tax=Folsomia candida TaxID=158441 RepID=A0A226EX27_FOLCA|nr:Acetylcholine receptor subunit alpha-type acr-16 [Folsomia candida]
MNNLQFLVVTFFFILKLSPTSASPDESRIIKSILSPSYDKLTRPVATHATPLHVEIGLALLQILEVDEKQQILTTNVWFRTFWTDSGLVWNVSEYGNITGIRIPLTKIWSPDIFLYNTADEEIFQSIHRRKQLNALVSHDGRVIFVPPMIIKSTCKMDVTWFPFDSQSCNIQFGSWSYSGQEIDFNLVNVTGLAFDLSEYVTNGEWKLVEFTGRRMEKFYGCSILGFTLPPDSGEKLSLGVTVLFSLIVFINVIAGTMPANSDGVPLLGTYFNCVMFAIASSVVSTIVVNLKLKCHPGLVKRMGKRGRKVLLKWLPFLLGMEQPGLNMKEEIKRTIEEEKQLEITNGIEECVNCRHFKREFKGCEITRSEKEWMFAAVVVEKVCLTGSICFAIISTVVLLVSAIYE